MKTIRYHDEDRPDGVVIGTGDTEESAIREALTVIGCNAGPLAIRAAIPFSDFADRVADAFGGEATVSISDE